MNELLDAAEGDVTWKVASVAQDETDRMNVLPEIGDAGDTGEADRMNALSEVVEAGSETDRVDALLDIGTQSCEAGADSGRPAFMEDVPVEASLLQFVDAVGGTPVVAQMQIPMVVGGNPGLHERALFSSRSVSGSSQLGCACFGVWTLARNVVGRFGVQRR